MPDNPEVHRELGAHDARLAHLEDEMQALREQMTEVLSILNQTKGSWKTLVALGGLIAALASAATWLLTHLPLR